MNTRLLLIHAVSPLHPGTGQAIGAIDLPIARERATGVPYLPGSSIKGVLRDRFAQAHDAKRTNQLFGPPTDNASDHAGSVQISDGRLLFFPVRSLAGTFAYVTSPYLLDRFARDVAEVKCEINVPTVSLSKIDGCKLDPESVLLLPENVRVVFEDLVLQVRPEPQVGLLGQALAQLLGWDEEQCSLMRRRICVVHDDVMSFLMEQATEVRARIRLDPETKTVARGALWYEENLPAESVLVSLVLAAPPKKVGLTAEEALGELGNGLGGLLQFGGDATVGKGLCRVHLVGGEA